MKTMLQEGKADCGTQKQEYKHMQVNLSEGRKERKKALCEEGKETCKSEPICKK